ncbi:MAG: response regulator [Opitutaceae bacterium]|nr:response regulator [Cytophagales bacterium]
MDKKFKRILLVDDELICNYISIKWVRRLQIAEDIHVLTNGKQALEFIRESFENGENDNCPDLILLDIKMPVMDGIEFLKEFHNSKLPCKDKIKIVLLTSSLDNIDVKEASRYNIHGYLEKPLNREKIEEVILKLA